MQYEKTAKRNPGRFAVAGQRANAPPFAEGLQAIFITCLQVSETRFGFGGARKLVSARQRRDDLYKYKLTRCAQTA